MIEPVSVAVHAVNRTPITLGDTAVVVGSGLIGLLVIQAARLAGCTSVIAVDLDKQRLELARRLGADVTLDAGKVDVPAEIRRLTDGRGAAVVFEVVGAATTVHTAIESARKGGTVTLVGNLVPRVEVPLQAIVTRELNVLGTCASNGEYPACIDLLTTKAIQVEPTDHGPGPTRGRTRLVRPAVPGGARRDEGLARTDPQRGIMKYDVDLAACRGRQRRLLEELESQGLQRAILTQPRSVQWLTGAYVGPMFEMAAAIEATGHVTLAIPEHATECSVAADEVVAYEAQSLATLRDDMVEKCTAAVAAALSGTTTRTGSEFGRLSQFARLAWDTEWRDLTATIHTLRRRKDADELRMLARANEANRAMYEAAQANIEPGINELDLYRILQSVAVQTLGEPLTDFGQDFQCCSSGGPPRDRVANAGELYILDLGVGFRGYSSDNARTFAVSGERDAPQQRAWEVLTAVFAEVESTVRPGVSCRGLYDRAVEMLAACSPWSFGHHLGHGVGLAPHEMPHLNPNWDEYFEAGDFFTVEPGLYHDDLRYGLRLEQNYLVTEQGVELLTPWPL